MLSRASEKGLDSFRSSRAPLTQPLAKPEAKSVEPVPDAFEPARTRLKIKADPLAPHLTAPMARDEVSLRQPKGHPVTERLSGMLKKHPTVAERAFLAEAILFDVRDPKERYAMTERFLKQHPELIPLFILNALARPLEAGWGQLKQDAVVVWKEVRAEWQRLMRP